MTRKKGQIDHHSPNDPERRFDEPHVSRGEDSHVREGSVVSSVESVESSSGREEVVAVLLGLIDSVDLVGSARLREVGSVGLEEAESTWKETGKNEGRSKEE